MVRKLFRILQLLRIMCFFSLVLRSCYEYSEYGLKMSGMYSIDPDGKGIGLPPIEVYCNFDLGKSFLCINRQANFTDSFQVLPRFFTTLRVLSR